MSETSPIAQFNPEERVHQVVDRSEKTAAQATQSADLAAASQVGLLPSKEKYLGDAENNEVEIARIQEEQAALTGFAKVKDAVTFGPMDRKTRLSMQEQQLANNRRAADRLQGIYDEEVEIEQRERQTATHESTVAEANRRNIGPDNYVSPIEPSAGMTEALKKQDEIAAPLKEEAVRNAETQSFYKEIGHEAEPQYLLPPEIVKEIKEALEMRVKDRGSWVEADYHQHLGKIEAETAQIAAILTDKEHNYSSMQEFYDMEKKLLDLKRGKESYLKSLKTYQTEQNKHVGEVTACFEAAAKVAEEMGVELNLHLFVKAFQEGMQIFSKGSNEGWRKATQVFGRQASASEVGYHEMGAALLENFFQFRPKIQDKAKIPYIMAFAAGAMEFGSGLDIADHMRKWVAASVNVSQTEVTQRDGQRNEETTVKPLGFDKFFDPYIKRTISQGGNAYPSIIEGLKIGNDVAIQLVTALEAHRYNDAKQRLMPHGQEYTHPSVLKEAWERKLPKPY